MDERERHDRLAKMAASQHGVFTRRQAVEAGFSSGQARRRVTIGRWEPVDHGVYRVAGTPPSWMQRLLAACLAGPAVASHRSAAALWQLPGFDPAPIEVTAVRHLRRHACDVVWHESRRLDEREVTAIDRIPVTRAARTLVDLGSVVDVPALQAAMDDAFRRNLASTDAVLQTIERLGERRRGAGNVRTVLKRRLKHGGIPESVIESAFDELVRSAGLQPFERQYVVCDARGAFVARVDFARPDRRLGVEIDSVRHHAGVDDWRHDLARQNQLLACRWRLLRFTAHDLERRPEWIVRMVLAALDPTMRI